MAQAMSLGELFEIREANRKLLLSYELMGTALGRKNGNGPPAILCYVPQKIDDHWLQESQRLPRKLSVAGGPECPTDVITSVTEDYHLQTYYSDGSLDLLRSHSEVTATDRPGEKQQALIDLLRGGGGNLTPGSQLGWRTGDGGESSGTLGCFALTRQDQRIGFLTNAHVGEFVNSNLAHPTVGSRNVGIVREQYGTLKVAERHGKRIPGDAQEGRDAEIDCAFCEQHQDLAPDRVDVRAPFLVKGKLQRLSLDTSVFRLDWGSMDPVGLKVSRVGRTRGAQEGEIRAVAYEYPTGGGRYSMLDYLVVDTRGGEFSDPGDSGSLLFTSASPHRPVALMWGGEWGRLRHGSGLENWTYATAIDYILDLLDLDILPTNPTP